MRRDARGKGRLVVGLCAMPFDWMEMNLRARWMARV